MRISVTIFVILISTYIVNASVLDPVIENVVHRQATKPPGEVEGIWKKKTIWKPRWIKEWKSAKVTKPVWRKVWGPVQIREWVPIPKPPPGWNTIPIPLAPVSKPQNPQIKDSHGHASFSVQSQTKIPLWDPVPYPESQQPPPPPPPSKAKPPQNNCDKGTCDSASSQTFNHQQISEILGNRLPKPQAPNQEYSETANQPNRVPPNGNNWRPPQQLPSQLLPEFLIPPKFQALPPKSQTPNAPPPINNIPKWAPLPTQNKASSQKTLDQPYRFQLPLADLPNQNRNNSALVDYRPQNHTSTQPQPNKDLIQLAELVGEYHYSEFDLPNFQIDPRKPQENLRNQEMVQIKPDHRFRPLSQEQTQQQRPNPLFQSTLQIQQPTLNQPPQQSQLQKPNTVFQQNFQAQQHRPNSVQETHIQQRPNPGFQENIPNQQQRPQQENLQQLQQKLSLVLKENIQLEQPKLSSTVQEKVQQQQKVQPQQQWPQPIFEELKIRQQKPSPVVLEKVQMSQQRPFPVFQHQNQPVPNKVQPLVQENSQMKSEIKKQEAGKGNVQKKHIAQPLFSVQQDEALIKEIFPIYRRPEITTPSKSNDKHQSSTKLFPVAYYPEINSTNTEESETPVNLQQFVVPPNHRFSAPQNGSNFAQSTFFTNHKYTVLQDITQQQNITKPKEPKRERVQLVFATTPEDYNQSTENLRKTTTEPYEIIFSSSLQRTTERTTKSPVVVVTAISAEQS